MKKYALLFIIIILALSGCATLSKSDLPIQSEIIELEPQKIDLAYDMIGMRIDLMRQTTTQLRTVSVPDSKGQFVTKTESYQEQVAYHTLGVDMGNGIFLDANMNLSLNMFQLFGIGKDQDFTIVKKQKGWFGSEYSITFTRSGSKFTIENSGPYSAKIEIEMKGNKVSVNNGIFTTEQEFIVEDGRITTKYYSPLGGSGQSYITMVGSSVSIPGFWKDTSINKNKDGSINLGDALVVRHEGKKIVFKYAGWFGSEYIVTMIRSKNKIVYYDERLNGVMIEFLGDRVKIKSNAGEEEYTVTKK